MMIYPLNADIIPFLMEMVCFSQWSFSRKTASAMDRIVTSRPGNHFLEKAPIWARAFPSIPETALSTPPE
jgi:hypothetical protein